MYWNQVKAAKVAGCSGWIVTLDVLKFPYLDDEGNKIPVE